VVYLIQILDDPIIKYFVLIFVYVSPLQQANLEESNIKLRKSLLTFVVAGGGFNGIETVAQLNDAVRGRKAKY